MKNKFVFLFILFFVIACNNASEQASSATEDLAEPAAGETSNALVSTDYKSKEAYGAADSVTMVADNSNPKAEDKTKSDLSPVIPKLIKTGYLTVEVEDYQAYRKNIATLATQCGGYLGNESEVNETYRISNDITIRVPVKAFDQIMAGLAAQGLKTDSRRIEVQDVGEEYADLQARIIAKQAVEKRYLDILNKAGKISDILEVEEKLRVIREETEAAQGRVKFLESQVTFSTINLNFYKTIDAHYTPPSGPGFLSRIWSNLVKGWESVLEVIIGLTFLWPLWVILIIIVALIRRRHYKFRIWPFGRSKKTG